ncbi:MAG: carboxypeptidase regulatory-like domain-containing protein [Muribaculaceae bacterium]|nr:carboxypeptidase regulatory-like domain-containing protein [Muribaculaceae bacterium]
MLARRIIQCLIFLSFFIFSIGSISGQNTTSSISGEVTNESGDIIGAVVQVKHNPSGSQYGTISNSKGQFRLEGLRVGGPYTIEISYVGCTPLKITDVYLSLSETYNCKAHLKHSTNLDDVEVVASGSKFSSVKTGASTHITSKDIQYLPNISRGLNDMLRLSPYANSKVFAGQDQRMNNYTVDGANFNFNMGLDGKVLPGGDSPISIDAIEEAQVSIAPYDVRQTNFFGAGINVVTKAGTNQFKGSAYFYYKNQDLRGNKIDGTYLAERAEESRAIYGFSLGGPIIKNKLFFFVNGEYEDSPTPIHKWSLSENGVEDTNNFISRVTASDMSKFSGDLKQMYGYDTGSWTDFSGGNSVKRVLGRLDWNINQNHKFMFRANYTSELRTNNVVGSALGINGGPVSRYSMTFRNSTWTQANNVYSFVGELNSHFDNGISNKLLATYTFNDGNKRECNGDFPTVDIMKVDESGVNRAFMNAGYDQHAWRNGIKEKVWAITDNVSMTLGRHSLVGGLSFEMQNLSNSYMRYGAGYYRYATYDDFVNKAAPIAFALCYSLTGDDVPKADVKYGQASIYAQDEFTINSQIKLFYGLRMDLPMYLNDRYENPSIADRDFNGTKLTTAQWPKATPLLSPRIGINYDVFDDQSLIIRGGTGIFTGRLPMIFFSKIQEKSGMLQNTVTETKAGSALLQALAGGIRTPEQILSEIAPKFPDRFPTTPGAVAEIATIDRNFKMPQAWKTSLAVDCDIPLPFPMSMTVEGTFIKNINTVIMKDVNIIDLEDDKMMRLTGADNRYRYPGNVEKRINRDITNAILMTNTNKGYSCMFNASLKTEPIKNLNFMVSYTYTYAQALTSNTSNQIDGAWKQEPTVNGPNNLTLHHTSYDSAPHRLIANLTYTIDYKKNGSSRFSLFYTGMNTGRVSYNVNGDINNDGYWYDLMYIPKDESEMSFTEFKAGSQTFTVDDQKQAFTQFINNSPYLSSHRGEYAQAYGALMPFMHRFDFRYTRAFKLVCGKAIHTLELSVDLMNVGNLINSSWGTRKVAITNTPITFKGLDKNNTPLYNMGYSNEDGVNTLRTEPLTTSRNSVDCWGLQFGIRYVFN